METYSLIVRKARLRDRPSDKTFDIAVSDGKIVSIKEHISEHAEHEIGAEGNLVSETFANPHIHMCKVYTYLMIGEEAVRAYQESGMSAAMLAIEIASEVKKKYHESWIYENAKKAVLESLRFGGTYLRAFVDTDTKAKLEGIKALLRLKKEFQGIVDIQVVAFPQDGIVKDPGAEEYVEKALEMGADVVGGIPWIEVSPEFEDKHIDVAFELAKKYNKDIAMLTDDAGDPFLRTTFKLAQKAYKEKWFGRVTANHARAVATYSGPSVLKLAELARLAGMSLVTDPQTGPLYLPFKQMLQLGVNVALGQDDIADAYYPFGRNNMLEVAFLASHITWSMTLRDLDTFFDMITWRARKAMNIPVCGIKEGCPADLLVHNYKTVYETIWYHEPPAYVIRNGRIVVKNSSESKFYI
ncbi:MAG: amidohydrolase family protein [Fervidicoccaceae archaeon]